MNDERDRTFVEEMLDRALPARPEPPPTEALWARVQDALDDSEQHRAWHRGPRRWWLAAAAALAVVALSLVFVRPRQLPDPAGVAPDLAQVLTTYRTDNDRLVADLSVRVPGALAASRVPLQALDEAADDLWQALREQPDSGLHAERLLAYLQWKNDMLSALARRAETGGASS